MENNILESQLVLVNNKIHFKGNCGEKPLIDIDYTAPFGDDEGYTSLELLLLSLSSCAASSVALLLRKMQKQIDSLRVNATGIRYNDHPTGFRTVILEFNIDSPDIQNEDVEKVLALSEEKYCPVWNMLKGNVDIKSIVFISQSEKVAN
jgi:putative redox protein